MSWPKHELIAIGVRANFLSGGGEEGEPSLPEKYIDK